jgi:hypothetical protein
MTSWPTGQLNHAIHHRDDSRRLLVGHHRADRQRDDFAMEGFGRSTVSSLSRVPRPPARITAFGMAAEAGIRT